MDTTTRNITLFVGIISLMVFFFRVTIIINTQIMIGKFGEGYLEEYLSGYSFSGDLRRQLTLIEIESLFNLLFFLVTGIGCIIIYFRTRTTKERSFGSSEYSHETEEKRDSHQQLMMQYATPLDSTPSTAEENSRNINTELYTSEKQDKAATEKGIKSLNEKTKSSILFLSGLVFVLVYSWQLLPLLNSSRFDFAVFIMPLVYALVAACVIGIIAYAIVKYRMVEIA